MVWGPALSDYWQFVFSFGQKILQRCSIPLQNKKNVGKKTKFCADRPKASERGNISFAVPVRKTAPPPVSSCPDQVEEPLK